MRPPVAALMTLIPAAATAMVAVVGFGRTERPVPVVWRPDDAGSRILTPEAVVRPPVAFKLTLMLPTETVRLVSLGETLSVLPDFVRPLPAVIEPAPENCVQTCEVVPTVIGAIVVWSQPVEALTVPSSTHVKAATTSLASSSSSVRTKTEILSSREALH